MAHLREPYALRCATISRISASRPNEQTKGAVRDWTGCACANDAAKSRESSPPVSSTLLLQCNLSQRHECQDQEQRDEHSPRSDRCPPRAC